MIRYIFIMILLFLSIFMVIEKNNFKLVVYFSVFSLISAALYFYYSAPDVALAEIAVGSAFTPLIFLIAIAKQKTFTVIQNFKGVFQYTYVLEEFCDSENLKLKLLDSVNIKKDENLHGIFRRKDVDLIINYDLKKDVYEIRGNKSNKLIDKFANKISNNNHLKLVRISDSETVD